MNVTLLGTGACEGIPSLWCSCPLCCHAREHGGKEVRRRTSFLIGRDTMVDFGPDAKAQCEMVRLNACELKRILITHSHIDHFQTVDMMWHGNCKRELKIFGSDSVLERLHAAFRKEKMSVESLHIIPVAAHPGEEIRDGALSILPIRAAHGDPGETALNYLLTGERGEKILLLADTGWLPEESLAALEGRGADAAVFGRTGVSSGIECRIGAPAGTGAARGAETGRLHRRDSYFPLFRRFPLRTGAVFRRNGDCARI